jgi:RNA polymerase sigma factor (sigma-70 family)
MPGGTAPETLVMQEGMRHTAEEPLAALYRRFGPAIHRRARAILRDDQEAFDVTQDTFLDYMRYQASLRGEASAFTVLYQIATNKAVDRLRRNSRWSGVLGPLDIREDEHCARPGPWASSGEGGLARVEALRDLSLLTEGESPQAISAAVLYFAEGYTMQEIAQTLDLHRKAVSALLHKFAERARQRSVRFNLGEPS